MTDDFKLCYCLAARRSARSLSRMYDRHLAPVGINIQQMSMLSMISGKEGVSIADLAEEMAMERTTLLRALRPLLKGGLVLSKVVGSKRSLALRVSARGQRKLVDAKIYWMAAQREFEASFGAGRAEHLREELKAAV